MIRKRFDYLRRLIQAATVKNSVVAACLLASSSFIKAQELKVETWSINASTMSVDSLELMLPKTKPDTLRARLLAEIAVRYAFNQPEQGLKYGRECLALAQRLNDQEGIADANQACTWSLWAMGDYNVALQFALKSLHQYEALKNWGRIGWLHLTLAVIYRDIGDLKNARRYTQRGIRIYDSLQLSMRIPFALSASIYEKENGLDSALVYVKKARTLDLKETGGKWGWIYLLYGNIHTRQGDFKSALSDYRNALPLTIAANINKDIVDIYNNLAILFKRMGKIDSSLYYANEILQKFGATSYEKGVLEATNILVELYKIKDERDSTIKYLEVSVALNNKLFSLEKHREIQNISFNEQARQEEIIRQRKEYNTRLKLYALLALGIIFLVITLLLWRHNQLRQKAFVLIKKQQEATDYQKSKAEQALAELKATQAQLIQSEKMASLGELTAGIAHEIQNPLNFINNFSDVNKDLLEEMLEELASENYAEVKLIAGDLTANEEKINHHGKRADAIVKGMLQHSRSSSGIKEATDINTLADEYLRLAYHGFRAKDNTFNATIKTAFDDTIGPIQVIPQDIGRVLLNLFNNAFYTVKEKAKQQQENYEPTVSVSTEQHADKLLIKVKDNGNGIPRDIADKIFQPFFTTKPTGEGTGLGLSLSYDIVHAHGGELQLASATSGSEFIIYLTASRSDEK